MTDAQATWYGPMPNPQRQRRGVLGPVLGLVLLGFCALLFIGLVSDMIGFGPVALGALCALLPVGPVVATFLWLDRWEPEPPRLLLLAFAWGAGVAALTALLVNTGGQAVAAELLGAGPADAFGSVVLAPVVEELVKGAFLIGLLVLHRREFDGLVDGVVYAGLVATGFAFTENILYFGNAVVDSVGGMDGAVLGLFIVRGIQSPFAHPLFTAMTGIAVGIAAQTRSRALRVPLIAGGFLAAIGLHALWNGAATFGDQGTFLQVYSTVMVPLFLLMAGLLVWQRRREQRIVAEQLPGFAQAGWIAPSEIPLLSSLAGRRGWQRAVRQRSGKVVAKAVVDYQAAVTKLAFLRAKMARGSAQVSGPLWHDQAVRELRRARDRAIGHPEALTVALRHNGPVGGWTPPPAGPPPTPHGGTPHQGTPLQGAPHQGIPHQGTPHGGIPAQAATRPAVPYPVAPGGAAGPPSAPFPQQRPPYGGPPPGQGR